MASGGIQAAQIADLMTFTLEQYKKDKFTDLMSPYQKTRAFKRIYRQKKVKNEDGDGTSITFNLLTDTNGSFRFVGLGFTANLSTNGNVLQGNIPWRGWTYNWWVDGAEPSMNKGPAQIVDIMKTRLFQAVGDMIKGVEVALWRAPSTTSDNVLGIPYYIVKSATAATYANNDGFNGLVPSGHTTVANINPTTYPRWRNYSDAYTAVTKDDLVRKLRRAAEKTDFMPLVDDEPIYDTGMDYGWYTNYSVYGSLVEVAESQNDDLGPDVAPMDGGKIMFRRAKLDWLPALEDDTTGPIYGIDWGTMYAARLNGWWEKVIKVPLNPQQPTVAATHFVTRTNLICTDRRKNCVLSTGTTMPS